MFALLYPCAAKAVRSRACVSCCTLPSPNSATAVPSVINTATLIEPGYVSSVRAPTYAGLSAKHDASPALTYPFRTSCAIGTNASHAIELDEQSCWYLCTPSTKAGESGMVDPVGLHAPRRSAIPTPLQRRMLAGDDLLHAFI